MKRIVSSTSARFIIRKWRKSNPAHTCPEIFLYVYWDDDYVDSVTVDIGNRLVSLPNDNWFIARLTPDAILRISSNLNINDIMFEQYSANEFYQNKLLRWYLRASEMREDGMVYVADAPSLIIAV